MRVVLGNSLSCYGHAIARSVPIALIRIDGIDQCFFDSVRCPETFFFLSLAEREVDEWFRWVGRDVEFLLEKRANRIHDLGPLGCQGALPLFSLLHLIITMFSHTYIRSSFIIFFTLGAAPDF